MDVSGVWTGEYEYERSTVGRRFTFTLRLRQKLFGRVSGLVVDGPGGMPEEGLVVGRARGRRLTFWKHLPVARVLSEDGTRTLAEHAAGLGYEVDEATPHPPIRYDGVISDDGSRITGTWEVAEHVVPVSNAAKAIKSKGFRGTWCARREEGGGR